MSNVGVLAKFRGLSELMSVAILIGVTLIIGVSFMSLVIPQMSTIVLENDVKSVLYSEQANLVMYKEFEGLVKDKNAVCLGVLRINPDYVVYGFTVVNFTSEYSFNSVTVPGSSLLFFLAYSSEVGGVAITQPGSVVSLKVKYLVGGEYMSSRSEVYVYLTPWNLVENYVVRGKPLLVCVDKGSLITSSRGNLAVMALIMVSGEMYEVGRIYI